jgi:predicted dithiol-disulfide oxidoreductase (DUF899 family)
VRRALTMNKVDDPKVAAAIADERLKNEEAVEHHPVVSQEEWVKQRLKLMEKEKQHIREGMSWPQTYTLSGHSIFYKNAKGEIFHTYGAFARGDEQFMGIFKFLDALPKGREEYGPVHSLPDWAKVHDQYESDGQDETACGCASR